MCIRELLHAACALDIVCLSGHMDEFFSEGRKDTRERIFKLIYTYKRIYRERIKKTVSYIYTSVSIIRLKMYPDKE